MSCTFVNELLCCEPFRIDVVVDFVVVERNAAQTSDPVGEWM